MAMPLSIDVICACCHPSLFQQQQPRQLLPPQPNKDNRDNLFFSSVIIFKDIKAFPRDYNKIIIFLLVALFSLILVQTFD